MQNKTIIINLHNQNLLLTQPKINWLYQCQSQDIIHHCIVFTAYPGSGRTFTTHPHWDTVL